MNERPNLEVVIDNTQERSNAENGYMEAVEELQGVLDSLEETLGTYAEIPVGGRMVEAANDNEFRLAAINRAMEAIEGLREKHEGDRFVAPAVELAAARVGARIEQYAIDADLVNMSERNPAAMKLLQVLQELDEKVEALRFPGEDQEKAA